MPLNFNSKFGFIYNLKIDNIALLNVYKPRKIKISSATKNRGLQLSQSDLGFKGIVEGRLSILGFSVFRTLSFDL